MKQRSIYLSYYQTDAGIGAVSATDVGVLEVWFPQPSVEQIDAQLPELLDRNGNTHSQELARQIEQYFNGERSVFDFKPDHSGLTAFTVKVLEAARTIPMGETRTYGWLAEQAGSPKAFRAAGQVVANNRLPIVIPCHRILGHSRTLGGFSGGLDLKIRLLEMEGHDISRWLAAIAA